MVEVAQDKGKKCMVIDGGKITRNQPQRYSVNDYVYVVVVSNKRPMDIDMPYFSVQSIVATIASRDDDEEKKGEEPPLAPSRSDPLTIKENDLTFARDILTTRNTTFHDYLVEIATATSSNGATTGGVGDALATVYCLTTINCFITQTYACSALDRPASPPSLPPSLRTPACLFHMLRSPKSGGMGILNAKASPRRAPPESAGKCTGKFQDGNR